MESVIPNVHQIVPAKPVATMAAVKPPKRFGVFNLHPDEIVVRDFKEKPEDEGTWVNGGFFVLEPEVIDYIDSDRTAWEQKPMSRLAAEGQLGAFRHPGFWQPMDTLRDKNVLEELWASDRAPWKVWE